jgi:putative MATE family efflux protein
VYPAGLGVAGSALGTVLAQAGMAAAFTAVVLRAARRHGAPVRADWPGIRAAAAGGVPLVVRTLTLRAVLVVATAVASKLGDVPLAAHQVAFNIWMFLALTLDAVAIAAQAIVGRQLGSGDVAAARAATRRMVQWGLAVGVALGLLFALGRPLYVPLFTEDPAVRSLLSTVLLVVAVMQPVAGVVFVLDGVLIGAGDARYLAVAGVGVLLAFLVAAGAVLLTGSGLVALWWAVVVFMLARFGFLWTRARGDAWAVTGAIRR